MRRRDVVVLVGVALAAPGLARALSRQRPYRIGMAYVADEPSVKEYHEAFLAGLREHGFDPGRDVVVDVRYGNGHAGRVPALIDELVAGRPDLLAGIEQVVTMMRARTTTIPIDGGRALDASGTGLAQERRPCRTEGDIPWDGAQPPGCADRAGLRIPQ